MVDNNNLVLVGERLSRLGIVALENPTEFKSYKGSWGSISNFKEVVLGRIREVKDPCGNPVLAVFVSYRAESESGEDLCDFSVSEKRYVAVDKLFDYLAEKGIR